MSQQELHLLARIDAPSVVPAAEIAKIKDYREAVRHCWIHRRVKGMARNTLAELTGMRASHITDYLEETTTDKHGNDRRDMPAKYIKAMESVCGNTFISQFVAYDSSLTVMESLLQQPMKREAA